LEAEKDGGSGTVSKTPGVSIGESAHVGKREVGNVFADSKRAEAEEVKRSADDRVWAAKTSAHGAMISDMKSGNWTRAEPINSE
jgi:hypothetical protein